MSRADKAMVGCGALFVLLVVANALDWAFTLGWRELALRRHDYAWELQLAWLAGLGRFALVDFAYSIGPLPQLLSFLGAAGSNDPGHIVGGMHLTSGLVSLAGAAALSSWLLDPKAPHYAWRRVGLFVALALLLLHDDVRAPRALASAWVIFAYRPGRWAADAMPEVTRRDALRGGGALLLTAFASVDTFVLGLASVGLMALYEAGASKAVRVAALRLAATLGVLLVGLVPWALLVLARGGSPLAIVVDTARIVTAYPVAMSLAAVNVSAESIALLIALSALPLFWTLRGPTPDRTTGLWIIGALAVTVRALYRSDAEHVYAGLLPLGLVMVALAFRTHARRYTRGTMALLALLFGLASVFPMSARTAWRPSVLLDAGRAIRGERTPVPYDTDLERAHDYLTATADGECAALTLGLGVAHVSAGVDGPSTLQLPWTSELREELAQRIREARCPRIISTLWSFDIEYELAGWTFGPDLLARAELYEPVERIGPAMFAARLREDPAPLEARDVEVEGLPLESALHTPATVTLRFAEPVPADHLLRVHYRVDSGGSRLGNPAYVLVQAHRGPDALREPTLLGGFEEARDAVAIVPLDAEHAEWRWIAGVSRNPPSADRVDLNLRSLGRRELDLRLVITRVEALAPPPMPESSDPICQSRVALERRNAWTRWASATHDGLDIAMSPNADGDPLAETFYEITPCSHACLVGEVGLPPGVEVGHARLEAHFADGPLRAMVFARDVGPGYRTPFEVPLREYADRHILLRFGLAPTAADGGPGVVMHRMRIEPCSSRASLVHALHQGSYETVRGEPRVSGDQITMPVPPWGVPPTEIRLNIPADALGEDACLAFDVDGSELGGDTVVAFEALRGARAVSISRDELERGDVRQVSDVSLAEWAGAELTLMISALPAGPHDGGEVKVLRPRVHTCGDRAPWAFGGEE